MRSAFITSLDGANAHGEGGGVASEVAIRPNQFDHLGMEFGWERDVGGGESGSEFHADGLGALVQDEVAAVRTEVGELVKALSAEVRDGREKTGAVVGDNFVYADWMSAARDDKLFLEGANDGLEFGVLVFEFFDRFAQGFQPGHFGAEFGDGGFECGFGIHWELMVDGGVQF